MSKAKGKGPRVLLFSAGRCPHCASTRALLRAQGVSFQELDVGRSAGAAARFRQLRARGVPVLLIGSRRIDGFQPDAIRQALRQAGLSG